MILTSLIMGIVVVGVSAVTPGIGVVLVFVSTLVLFGLRKDSIVRDPISKKFGLSQNTDKDSGARSANVKANGVWKILVVVLSSIVALLMSVLGVLLVIAIAIIAALISFIEFCAEILQIPG